VLASRTLARLAATWRQGVVAGERTWLSQNHGPAVVGLADPEIVMPRRITELPLEQQRMAVAHELEHIRARDQWLVRISAFAAVAAPWNPFLWLATRRLRSAIEIDCDARVLQKQPNVRAYASLVLNVAAWPRQFPAAAPALGETGVAQLERRLRLMTSDKRSPKLLAAITMLTAALALGAYGCDVAVSVDRPEPSVHQLPKVVTTATTADNAYFEFQVDKPVTQAPGSLTPRYPDLLRKAGIEGEVLAQFVVDAEGRADTASFKALKTSHQLFADAIRSALPVMRFVPAEVKGKRVRQLVQQPFAFAIAK
jgi:TonB family protein